MSRIPKPHEIYKHFKGNLYQIFAVAEHSETGEQLVIYQALYGEFRIYARPLDNFLEKVDRMKYPDAEQTFRFELQGQDKEPNIQNDSNSQKIQHNIMNHNDFNKQNDTNALSDLDVQSHKSECNIDSINRQDGEENQENDQLNNIDPMVMQFLDADTYEERLNILVNLRHRITDDMITTMAIACDVEVPQGDLDERFTGLKNCLITLEKFECNRLR